MPGKYQDHVTGEYYETQAEALYQERLHQEFFIAADDEIRAARRKKKKMEHELMEQERQRNIEREAWRQYQAKLKEQEERKRWMALPREQQIKEIIDKTMAKSSYIPPTLFSPALSGFFVVAIFAVLIKSAPKIDPIWSIIMFLFFIVGLVITKNALADYKTAKKKDDELIEEMKETARKTKSKALTIKLEGPLELKGSVYFLRHHIHFAAKYGFEVTNPELQALYNKVREKLARFNETQDLDWENLWNEKPRETAA